MGVLGLRRNDVSLCFTTFIHDRSESHVSLTVCDDTHMHSPNHTAHTSLIQRQASTMVYRASILALASFVAAQAQDTSAPYVCLNDAVPIASPPDPQV